MTLQTFTDAYLEAVVSTGADLPTDHFATSNGFSDAFLRQMRYDCWQFYVSHASILAKATHIQAGQDFWMTRQSYGAAYLATPKTYGAEQAETLHIAAQGFPCIKPFLDDENLISV